MQAAQTSSLAVVRLDPHTEPAAQVVAQLETRLVAVAVVSAVALVVEVTLAAAEAEAVVELDSPEEAGRVAMAVVAVAEQAARVDQ